MGLDYRSTRGYPLGIRNNNPGNLRPGHDWLGMVGENKGFVVFENIHYGIRALAMDLINKYLRGLNTVEKIISVYAPPIENNTNAYINSVCTHLGVTPNMLLRFDSQVLIKFVTAIMMHENGPVVIDKLFTGSDMIMTGIAMVPVKLLDRLK